VSNATTLARIAQEFSPRYECHRDDLVSIDVGGLERLLGPAQTIGEELRRDAAARGVRVHVAIAGTRTAALVLAQARPGVTVIARGAEADALAPIPIRILEKIDDLLRLFPSASSARSAIHRWGVKTLGELAALPAAELAARLGPPARVWQAIARGEDARPLVPTLPDERFESSLELEWPIDGLEPLSFVLTRLLEPLSTRLERRDRGVAVLHVILRLVTRDTCTCRLELPSPMRDVRALRTLALLDLDAHPPAAAIDRVTIVIEPTPGRVLQHTLFTRAHPTPEQLSTLLARLGALMGQDRLGAPAVVDSYRPGAFAMTPFATKHDLEHRARRTRGEEISQNITHAAIATDHDDQRRTRGTRREDISQNVADSTMERRARKAREENVSQTSANSAVSAVDRSDPASSLQPLASALRRCRHPVPARVAVADGRPARVTTDRRGFAGGTVVHVAGPWRTSGAWWAEGAGRPPIPSIPPVQPSAWNRDEWDVALNDGAVYRIFRDRGTDAWFIEAIVD